MEHADADGAATQDLFRTGFWRAPAAIAAIGVDGRLLACNAAYAEILGMEVSELIGMDAAAFVARDEVDQAVSESIERIEAGRVPENRPKPIRLERRDGGTVWVQFDSMLVEDSPELTYVLATMTDVTLQVEAQQALDRSGAWTRALLEHQSDVVTVVGFDGIVHYISPNCERVLGFRPDELIGTSGFDHIHPDDVSILSDGLSEQLRDGRDDRPIEYRQRRKDRSWLWLEASGRVLPEELGIRGVIVSARDVSERRRAAAAAQAAERRFRTAFASSPLGIAFSDLDGRLTWVNDALAELLGRSAATLLEMNFVDFSNPDDLPSELLSTGKLLRGEIESFSVEKRYEHPERRTIWTRLHISLVRDSDGAPAQFLGQLEDVTERRQREMHLAHDARHDPLTGLLNRSGLREQVDAAWSNRSRETPMAVLFGDLDGFKGVNDAFGHDAGDEVLDHVAQRLRSAVRDGDVVARWGGDEFVILCPAVASAEVATQIAERVRSAIEAPFPTRAMTVEIGISIGVAVDAGQPLPDLLIKDADDAAYRAKRVGRNQVVIA